MNRMLTIGISLLGFILMPGIMKCQEIKKLQIAISKGGPEEKYRMYASYVMSVYPLVQITDLDGMQPDKACEMLSKCDGLILTGGVDVHPRLYGREDMLSVCGATDTVRDKLELSLIQKALALKMPVFAICRGAQLLNVSQGGTLWQDIPSQVPSAIVHRSDEPSGAIHVVSVENPSLLKTITGGGQVKVNSFHHQAINKLADAFTAMARTEDGIVEAYTWKERDQHPFLIAVQWHPERMGTDDPMTGSLMRSFIQAVAQHRQ